MESDAVVEELRGIRTALEGIWTTLRAFAPEPEPEDPTDAPCPHPVEWRVGFGSTGGVEDWQCGVCGYRTVTT